MLKILKEKYKVDIDNYEIIRKINQGGFGIIYLVRDKNSKKELVAKVNLINTGENSRHKQFINRELAILMRVQHPTVIPLRGYSLQDFNGSDNITILMDYMKEGSVSQLIDKEQKGFCSSEYNNTKRQIILAGVARGMSILHKLHIIHRDLSSGNILLDEYFHPLITDFGLSKFFDPQHSKRQTLTESGTLSYMAPEVIEDDKYNTKADVYSFGILMYEIVTGSRAYENLMNKMNAFKLKMQILNGLRPNLDIPMKEGIKELIERCLLKNPDERPTFDELFEKLSLSFYDDFLSDENESKYCLDNVDLDEFLEYIEKITEDENDRLSSKIQEIEYASKKEIEKLKETIKDQENEIKSLKQKINLQKGSPSRLSPSPEAGNIGNFFYAEPSRNDPGIFSILKTKETSKFDPLFIPSQSNRDVYDLINPDTKTFFGTYSRSPDFFIDFTFENPIQITGIIIYSYTSHFPKSFKILVDRKVVKTIEDAEELNGKNKSMTVTFPEIKGTTIRFLQTSPTWEGKVPLFFKRFEVLSSEAKYSNGVFATLIEEADRKDPHLCKVLINASAFDLNKFYELKSATSTFIERINSWIQVELLHGLAIITGFRIIKNTLKSYKIIATDDASKPDDMWIKLFEVNEEEDRNKKVCDLFILPHPSPLVRFVKIVLTEKDWDNGYHLIINHFEIFGYYF